MKTGFTDLIALATELTRQRDAKKDYIANDNSLRMFNVPKAGGAALAIDHLDINSVIPMRDHAHGQLATHLDIPKRYYDRMRQDAPELLANNVNTWFADRPHNARRMVRTMDGQVRALLSDRYQRIEHQEIAAVALPILGGVQDMQIASMEVTERRLYIKAVFPRVQGEVKKGDVVQSGVVISNSEIGSGAVMVQPFMYRLICLNGMIREDERFRAMHLGAQAKPGESVYELLSDEARQADDKAILLKLRDVVAATASPTYFAKAVERFREAAGERIEGNVAKAVEVLAKVGNLSGDETNDVLRHLIEGGDLSRWGLANAVTRAAHDPESYDRATELESLGGQIIDLKPAQWREISMAA